MRDPAEKAEERQLDRMTKAEEDRQLDREIVQIMGAAGRGPEYMRLADQENTPFHIWHDFVFELAGVSVEEGRKYATRQRIQRAYQMGEKAWMGADMVRQFVRGGRLADRGDAEIEGLRQMIRHGLGRS